MRRPVVLAAALALVLAACTSKYTTFTGELKLGKTPEENYQRGVHELKAGNYTEAVKFFEFVRTKYPFDKHAALAELRLADAKYDQDRFAEAAEAYKQFVALHPTSTEVDYARFRQGLSLFKDAPGDFALFPPAYEKDQRQTEAAVQVLQEFVQEEQAKADALAAAKKDGNQPLPPEASKYLADARKVLGNARARLAAREWYVAEYYYKRKKWAGAAGRYQALVDRFPGTGHEVEALLKLAEAHSALDQKHEARKALQKLIVEHPQDPARAVAEQRLAALR
jgi:outer membrane protein assembly factor BamD